MVFVIDNIAYVGSGEVQGAAVSNEFFAYDASIDFWYPIAAFPGSRRTSAVAFSIDDKGYFGTGGMAFGSTDFWEYNPTFNLWNSLRWTSEMGLDGSLRFCRKRKRIYWYW